MTGYTVKGCDHDCPHTPITTGLPEGDRHTVTGSVTPSVTPVTLVGGVPREVEPYTRRSVCVCSLGPGGLPDLHISLVKGGRVHGLDGPEGTEDRHQFLGVLPHRRDHIPTHFLRVFHPG